MAPTCSAPHCTQPGSQLCGGCKTTRYCSQSCQKAQWKIHKLTCSGAKKYNCFVIRAAPASEAGQVFDNVPAQIEPLHLRNYGNEFAEKKELSASLNWRTAREVGKFYDHLGSDQWYYFVYGDVSPVKEGDSARPRNEISGRICYSKVYGDIAVVRSGPTGSVYPESFTHTELCKAVEFYKTEDHRAVFVQREKRRFFGQVGIPTEHPPPHIYWNSARARFDTEL